MIIEFVKYLFWLCFRVRFNCGFFFIVIDVLQDVF